jgi:hypothetical protein
MPCQNNWGSKLVEVVGAPWIKPRREGWGLCIDKLERHLAS